MRTRESLGPLVVLLLTASAAACSSKQAAHAGAPRTSPSAVHVQGSTFRDGQGRQLIFRGYNVKVAPLFDVTFQDGRTANETLYDFDDSAASRFEQLGFNAMRLAVNWSGLEPAPKQYSAAFFAQIDTMLGYAAAHGYYVLIDMHQDAYSKEIGEDGQPVWAITPTPTPSELLSGPYDSSRVESQPVLNAGFNFFQNLPAADGRLLQTAYAEAVQQIVKHVVGNPAVLGYEAFNEPVLFDQTELDAFHEALADAVHQVDGDAPLLFEPIALRNQTDSAQTAYAPWSHGAGAYAPHIYTGWFSRNGDSWVSQDAAALLPSMEAASGEAVSWGAPLFVTEFGCDQTSVQGPSWISAELDLQERFLASSTSWVWKETGTWGLLSPTTGENAKTALAMSRSFPRAVAGDIVSIAHPQAGDLVVTYTETQKTRGLPHEVSMSAVYATNYQVSCDGVSVPFVALTGRATFVCPATSVGASHTFEVKGTPN